MCSNRSISPNVIIYNWKKLTTITGESTWGWGKIAEEYTPAIIMGIHKK